MVWDGSSDALNSWEVGPSTFGEENEAGCTANGGVTSATNPTTLCLNEGDTDPITVTVADMIGMESIFIITDEEANLIETPVESTFDFNGAGPGVCLIWHLSYDESVNLGVLNASDLEGCYGLSNSITVTRNQPNSGVISTEDRTSICVRQEQSVTVAFEDVAGTNSFFIITNEDLSVLSSQTGATIRFEDSGAETCLIWHLSYEDGVDLNVTNAGEFEGCFSLSNSIEITRNSAAGGMVSTEGSSSEFTVVVGDGIDDNFTFENDSESTLEYIYITANENNVITGTFDGEINFEDDTAGNCRVYGASYSGILNDDLGESIEGVSSDGCFELSQNFVTIVKELFIGITDPFTNNISIYPTIVDTQLTISGVNSSYSIGVLNTSCQMVLNQQVTEGAAVIRLPNLVKGISTGKVVSNNINKSFRIIKN